MLTVYQRGRGMSIRKDLECFVTVETENVTKSCYEMLQFKPKTNRKDGKWGVKMMLEKKCNKNVIKMKKGVAFCKQVCYNSGTYKEEKE